MNAWDWVGLGCFVFSVLLQVGTLIFIGVRAWRKKREEKQHEFDMVIQRMYMICVWVGLSNSLQFVEVCSASKRKSK